MPRLLIYEECLAAGTQGPLGAEAKLFLPEGLAMTLAIAQDFAKLHGWQVRILRSTEFRAATQALWTWIDCGANFEQELAREARLADATIVIAPECGGLLLQRAQAVISAGGKLLGPSPEFIALASDKTALLGFLVKSCFRVPRGMQGTLEELAAWNGPFPVVLKPNDGVGASGVRCLSNREVLLEALLAAAAQQPGTLSWRCEEFIPGQCASVSILAGAQQFCVLQPFAQDLVFDQQGHAIYRGGANSLTKQQQIRAQIWGAQIWLVMSPTNGYFGIDLILGAAEDGSEDAILEVNPRLTTSYIGLRQATHQSLAEAMWQISQGETVNIQWLPNTVEFTKQGQVTIRDRSWP
jgi:predicted ATP-grasp superfamily ATP-dependent carboligase